MRRAAIYSWLTIAPDRGDRAMSLAKDPSPLVREAVAAALCPIDSRQWEIRFNDLRAVEEETDYNYREKARLPALLPEEEDLLRSMLGDDSSPLVKFQAAFTLLARSRTIDVPAFIRLVAAQDDQESSSRRVAGFLRSNYRKLGKPFANLLLYADAKLLEGDTLADMQSHFGINAVELSGFRRQRARFRRHARPGFPRHRRIRSGCSAQTRDPGLFLQPGLRRMREGRADAGKARGRPVRRHHPQA